jgi:hypothetical protein
MISWITRWKLKKAQPCYSGVEVTINRSRIPPICRARLARELAECTPGDLQYVLPISLLPLLRVLTSLACGHRQHRRSDAIALPFCNELVSEAAKSRAETQL